MADTQRGFSIGVFKAEMANKRLMRPNLFHIEFSLPPGLFQTRTFDDNIQTTKTLEYWCEATSLPGYVINTYQGQRYGYGSIEQRPLLPAYSEMAFNFIFDSETLNYDLFYDWMNIIINTNMSQGPNELTGEVNTGAFTAGQLVGMVPFELSYKQDYATDTSIIVYDQEGIAKKKLTLRESFPKSIGEIGLAWADNNTYMRLPIVFAFTDWYHSPLPQDFRPQQPPFAEYYNF